jgi:hypothetical protein
MAQQSILSKQQLAILGNEDKVMSGSNAHLNEKHREIRSKKGKRPKPSFLKRLFD